MIWLTKSQSMKKAHKEKQHLYILTSKCVYAREMKKLVEKVALTETNQTYTNIAHSASGQNPHWVIIRNIVGNVKFSF